jgi:hypothetical protein
MKAKKRLLMIVGLGIALAGTAVALQQAKQVKQRKLQTLRRWHPVTVNRAPGDTAPKSEMLKPLLDLGDLIKIRITPALGDKGTEIAARIANEKTPPAEAIQLLQKIHSALRDTQWLLETGEVLSADKPSPAAPKPMRLPMQFLARHARTGDHL